MIFKSLLWTGCLFLGSLQACVEDCPKNASYVDLRDRPGDLYPSSSDYQWWLARETLSEDGFGDGLFFVDEETAAPEEAEECCARVLSVFDRTLQPCSLDVLEETVAEIIQTDADVVCLHNLADEWTQYKFYNALRRGYGHFCVETRAGGSTLVASKHTFNKEECGFLDDDGIFFETNVLDVSNNVWRIVMVRPKQALSPERLHSAAEKIAGKLSLHSSSHPRPTFFCGNLSAVDFLPAALCSSEGGGFDDHENPEGVLCGLFLPPSFAFSQKMIRIPLIEDFQGLFIIREGLPAGCDSGSADRGRFGGEGGGWGGSSWGGHWSGEVGGTATYKDENGNTVTVHGEAGRDNRGNSYGGAGVGVSHVDHSR